MKFVKKEINDISHVRKATLLIGYDVERQQGNETKEFLSVAPKIHKELKAPCTFFVCGRTLENNKDVFQKVRDDYGDLIDFQQHTYSHILLKTKVYKDQNGGITIDKGATLSRIHEEVQKTNECLKKYLGVDCLGLTSPAGCYMGLMDRPDILEVIHQAGIRFIRSYYLHKEDPLDWKLATMPFEIQPFWYEPQKFPDILEFPLQGQVDCVWKSMHGYDKKEEYLNFVKTEIDYIAEEELSWSYAQHDWSSIKGDPEMSITKAIIKYAQKKDVEIISYLDYYKRMDVERIGRTKKENKRGIMGKYINRILG